MFVSPGSVALQTNFFTIYWYGIILAIAFAVGLFVILKVVDKDYNDKIIKENIYEITFVALLGGIIGARLYYVLLNSPYFLSNLTEIIMVNHGGLSIQGGLLGGILSVLLYCKKHNLNFLQYADLFALGLPIGQAIGRWGNFFNSEAFGLPTNLFWGVFIPVKNRPFEYITFNYFHPTFLYESIWNILVFIILFYFVKPKHFKEHGVLFFRYLMLYSFGRIVIENIRVDSVLNILHIPVAIWVCCLTILISGYFIEKLQNKYQKSK